MKLEIVVNEMLKTRKQIASQQEMRIKKFAFRGPFLPHNEAHPASELQIEVITRSHLLTLRSDQI
jgi:hypothetical protein